MFWRKRSPEDFAEEIKSHLEPEADDLKREGMNEDEARRKARREFGNVSAAQERFYMKGRWVWLDKLLRDIRFGLRVLIKNKGFTAVAIFALALGIGPTVAMFSIVWATFLAPLPYSHANELVVVWTKIKGERNPTRADDYLQYLTQNKSFQRLDFAAWDIAHLTSEDHSQEDISGVRVTPGFYSKQLGYRFALGRDFLPEEGLPGKDHVVIITNRLWKEHFNADPQILGKTIRVDDQPNTVVGVEPPGPPDRATNQFVLPVPLIPGAHNNYWGNIFGRLKPGVSLATAQAELASIDQRLAATRVGGPPPDQWSVSVEQLKNDWLDKTYERNLWLLLAAVGFVLLIACVNVANLLLARGSSRQKELALRSALGATRRQVFTQLLTESLTLACLGGAIGVALGWALIKLVMAILPSLSERTIEANVELNLPVLYFAAGVTLLGGVLFGCIPAWQASRVSLNETLKQGSRSMTGRGRMNIQGTLVVVEVALALTLLSGAGMALHSFWKLSQIDLGIQSDHVLTAWLSKRNANRENSPVTPPDQINADARELLEKLRSLPGVRNVALSTTVPLTGHGSLPFAIAGQATTDTNKPVADFEIVTPGYFNTFGIRLNRGRLMNDDDNRTSPPVVMVNESFAKRYFPGLDPLEQRILIPQILPHGKLGSPIEYQIVGVFHDILNGEHLTDQPFPEIFASFWQTPWPNYAVAVRSAIDPALMTKNLRGTIATVAPQMVLNQVQTMDKVVDTQLQGGRSGMLLFGGFAGVALLLAALGIYGVMAFAVAQRTQEIGLRMALGAQRHQVVMLMVNGGMKLALIGGAIGLAGVCVLGRLMHSTLYGIKSFDLASFSAVALALLAVAAIACYVPARRSAKIDPLIALREE
jgi:predicted permease